MQTVAVLLLVSVAVVAAHPPVFLKSPEHRACLQDMKSKGETEKKEMKEIVKKCIAEQPGVQEIIDALKTEEVPADLEGGSKGHAFFLFMKMSEHAGKASELKKCIGKAKGYINDDGSFNVEKLKADIIAKVAGTDSQAKTQLGLDKCPTDVLNTYDVMDYFECVMSYCATGGPPAA